MRRRLSQSSFLWFFLLGMFQGLLCPFYGLLLISIGCIGKNILLKMERFLRPLQSEWLPFCCDGLRLLAHFHAPLKFFQGCKSSLVSCPYKFKGPGCPQAKGSATRVPRINRINTLSGSAHCSLGEGFFPKDLFLSFIPNCLHINLFIVD